VISPLPDGRILVTYNAVADRNDAYGQPGPAFVSEDGGVTWKKYAPDDPLLAVSHSVISEVLDGEFLCVPISPSIDVAEEKVKLPRLLGKMQVYGEALFYRLSECPQMVQEFMQKIPAVRWIPAKARWEREEVLWDTEEAIARTRKSDYVIPRPYIDNRIVRVGKKLYYPDFHLNHLQPDGSMPKNYAAWLMVSEDNGRSWRRKAQIAYDATGRLMMGEPSLVRTSTGELACVIRCAHHQPLPMLITYSRDEGKTWEQPGELYGFGVMPQTLLLENGILAVSFGRPGVHLLFSPDGSARKWSPPLSLIEGNRENINAHSCGYTRLLPVGKNGFLIAYSDFNWLIEKGERCKAIVIRRISVG
jgi:hypothetical protein